MKEDGVVLRGRPRKVCVDTDMGNKVERVALGPEAVTRLDAWVKQVEGSRPGVEISRRDLIHWLILERSESLNSDEVRALSDSHYNELRFLQYALKELKAARTRGDTMSLQDFVAKLPGVDVTPSKAKRGRKKRSEDTPSDHATESEFSPSSQEKSA
jgi:hypothetical protein